MPTWIIPSLVLSGVVFVIWYFIREELEFGKIALVAVLSVTITGVFISDTVGQNNSKAELLTFNENYNGSELSVRKDVIKCSKNGPCRWEWSCEPHLVQKSRLVCTGTGESRSCRTDYYYVTEYHSCPYVKEEWRFTVNTTLGEYVIGGMYRLQENPQQNRWTATSDSIPKNLPSQAPVGVPQLWRDAKDRIDSGDPGYVVKRFQYDNYIYASQHTILDEYSSKIESYIDRDLMPAPQMTIKDYYHANKVKAVGRVKDIEAWNWQLGQLDAALGSLRQGDLHLILVTDEDVINEIDDYIIAVKAHWQDVESYGDDVISKNAIIVVIGSQDGKTVSIARAETGMPLGNENVIDDVARKLIGVDFTPDAILGNVVAVVQGGELQHYAGTTSGVLGQILFDDPGFIRISMSGEDEDDVGTGFLYLDKEIGANGEQQAWIIGFNFLFGIIGMIISTVIVGLISAYIEDTRLLRRYRY